MTKQTNWRMALAGMMPVVHPDDREALVARIAEKAREAIQEFEGVEVNVCAFQAGSGETQRFNN